MSPLNRHRRGAGRSGRAPHAARRWCATARQGPARHAPRGAHAAAGPGRAGPHLGLLDVLLDALGVPLHPHVAAAQGAGSALVRAAGPGRARLGAARAAGAGAGAAAALVLLRVRVLAVDEPHQAEAHGAPVAPRHQVVREEQALRAGGGGLGRGGGGGGLGLRLGRRWSRSRGRGRRGRCGLLRHGAGLRERGAPRAGGGGGGARSRHGRGGGAGGGPPPTARRRDSRQGPTHRGLLGRYVCQTAVAPPTAGSRMLARPFGRRVTARRRGPAHRGQPGSDVSLPAVSPARHREPDVGPPLRETRLSEGIWAGPCLQSVAEECCPPRSWCHSC